MLVGSLAALLSPVRMAPLLLPPQAVSYWSKAVRASGNSMGELQAVIEKSVVLGLATNTASTSHSLAELVTTYASTLATQVLPGGFHWLSSQGPGDVGALVFARDW